MKNNYKKYLKDITTFILDVDGVMTNGKIDQSMTKIKRLTLTVPPLRGPLPQGLNVPLKQVKTVVKSENINGRQRQHRQGSTERRS